MDDKSNRLMNGLAIIAVGIIAILAYLLVAYFENY